ncbi:type IV secretory pathway TrbL component [Rhizobium azooxidifex]|uniref:Type IV secretory pathway TrbL component n=1 Tax=Mycoplana azooxidifex TaxID=1636188 RepID=A0A7W6DGD3_9HYPH|nr:hypothetical protein [Mycoplana azooxidifex]MBB3980127.1 type IV secretory pathway TrbL component [Mycoplana azooxidifex]
MIKIEITGDNAAMALTDLRQLSVALLGSTAAVTAPSNTVTQGAPETASAAPAKRKGKATETAATKSAETEQAAAEEPAESSAPENVESSEETTDDNSDTGEPEAPEVKVTMDNARKFAVAYVNDAAADQDSRRQLFSEITAKFSVTKFSDIPDGRLPEAVEFVKSKRAEKGLPAAEL